MGRDVTSLVTAMQCLASPAAFKADVQVPPINFNEQVKNKYHCSSGFNFYICFVSLMHLGIQF